MLKWRIFFYMQPLPQVPSLPGAPWCKNHVDGKNTLISMVKGMCEEAGILGKTNHSLSATGVTEMCIAGVPERIMLDCTGHRNLDVLRAYI